MGNPRGLAYLIVVLCVSGAARAADPLEGGVDPKRVAEIAATLGERPFAFGPTIDDRAAWDRLAKHKAYANVVRDAERLLDEPMPEMSEDVFLEYKRTGE